MLKNATELRRGAGKPYLVYGQMQKPANLEEIPIINWQYGGYDYEAPAVFDCLESSGRETGTDSGKLDG